MDIQINDSRSAVKRKFAICIVVAILIFSNVLHSRAKELRLATGVDGTLSWEIGNMICDSLNQAGTGLICTVVEVEEDRNLLTNLQIGSFHLAIIDSQLLNDALHSKGIFVNSKTTYDNLAAISPLYDVPVTIIAKKEIRKNLSKTSKHKWLNAGAPQTIESGALDLLLEATGWRREDFSLITELSIPESQDAMAYSTGNVKAMVHRGVHPDPALEHLFNLGDVEIINIDQDNLERLVIGNSSYVTTVIPAESYTTMSQSVNALATKVYLMTTEELENDVVYTIAKVLYKSEKSLQEIHQGCKSMKIKALPRGEQPVQSHPGAVAFFAEVKTK